jgi:hypothetical protein
MLACSKVGKNKMLWYIAEIGFASFAVVMISYQFALLADIKKRVNILEKRESFDNKSN